MPNFSMGWLPDRPDFRDYSIKKIIEDYNSKQDKQEITLVQAILQDNGTLKILKKIEDKDEEKTGLILPLKNSVNLQDEHNLALIKSVDLREWCSPIENQENLHSCTAMAGVALVEYFQKKVMGEYIDLSSLFLYKVTRKLMHLSGDNGASIRSTMKAMSLFGIPPEEYWPYKIETFDEEPSAFCYAYAQNYQALQYFRLDLPTLSKAQVLAQIKAFLAAGFPAMFGLTAYSCIFDKLTQENGKIPYPTMGEKVVGGHAVVAIGYDDNKESILIRNCWGEDWGEQGYGWLPYDYVLKGLATDWWSLLKNEWVDEGNFGLMDQNGKLLGDNDLIQPDDQNGITKTQSNQTKKENNRNRKKVNR